MAAPYRLRFRAIALTLRAGLHYLIVSTCRAHTRSARAQPLIRLTFRELEAFPRSRLTIFLALLHSRVAPQKAQLLQQRPQLRVELNQRPGNAVLDRARLTMHAAAFNKYKQVELSESFGSLQGLPHQHAVGFVEEVCFEGLVIYCDIS